MQPIRIEALLLTLATLVPLATASGLDEFKIKRQEVFEFAAKPQVTRQGDRVEIAFVSKAFCDVTVAIEDAQGKIIRHLVSGVLGPKAPEPLQKNSLQQTVVWDSKDDQGQYRDDKERLTVRVALGLKPRFERTLHWSPYRRADEAVPLMQAAPEGVYVYEARGTDHLKLFGHDGNYIRTVYPFPHAGLDKIQELTWHKFPQDDQRLPLKHGRWFCTLLTSGDNGGILPNAKEGPSGRAATAFAIQDGRAYLAHGGLNVLPLSVGREGRIPLTAAPLVYFEVKQTMGSETGKTIRVAPRSAALSPDGKRLYLAGYVFGHVNAGVSNLRYICKWDCLHGVVCVDLTGNSAPRVFAGSMEMGKYGTSDGSFRVPSSVATDAVGRVYVADYVNDRVQVFSPEGKFLKRLPVAKPAQLQLSPKGEIFVFSYLIFNEFTTYGTEVPVTLASLGTFENPQAPVVQPLPVKWTLHPTYRSTGLPIRCTLDFWADPPCVWMVNEIERPDALTANRPIAWSHVRARNRAPGCTDCPLRCHPAAPCRTCPRPCRAGPVPETRARACGWTRPNRRPT